MPWSVVSLFTRVDKRDLPRHLTHLPRKPMLIFSSEKPLSIFFFCPLTERGPFSTHGSLSARAFSRRSNTARGEKVEFRDIFSSRFFFELSIIALRNAILIGFALPNGIPRAVRLFTRSARTHSTLPTERSECFPQARYNQLFFFSHRSKTRYAKDIF